MAPSPLGCRTPATPRYSTPRFPIHPNPSSLKRAWSRPSSAEAWPSARSDQCCSARSSSWTRRNSSPTSRRSSNGNRLRVPLPQPRADGARHRAQVLHRGRYVRAHSLSVGGRVSRLGRLLSRVLGAHLRDLEMGAPHLSYPSGSLEQKAALLGGKVRLTANAAHPRPTPTRWRAP